MTKLCVCCGQPAITQKLPDKKLYKCMNCGFAWTSRATPGGLKFSIFVWKAGMNK